MVGIEQILCVINHESSCVSFVFFQDINRFSLDYLFTDMIVISRKSNLRRINCIKIIRNNQIQLFTGLRKIEYNSGIIRRSLTITVTHCRLESFRYIFRYNSFNLIIFANFFHFISIRITGIYFCRVL